jgi:hypothetical protein
VREGVDKNNEMEERSERDGEEEESNYQGNHQRLKHPNPIFL